MNPEEKQCADYEEADALFAECDAVAIEARETVDREARCKLWEEAGRLHRLAWEAKRRAEHDPGFELPNVPGYPGEVL